MKMYRVDYGDTFAIMSEKTLREITYKLQIDHTEYPDFEGWLWDMQRCGLVTEI